MALYSKVTNVLKKKNSKLNYVSPSVIRSLYLIKSNPIHHNSEKKIFSRGSCIPNLYINSEVTIHKGNKFQERNINKWQVGFKFGSFTWNRKLALYKAKQKKKKK